MVLRNFKRPDAGEGHLTLLPFTPHAVSGTFSIFISATSVLCAVYYNNAAADGEYADYKLFLSAGTYDLKYLCQTNLNHGILDLLIDGVEIASFDTYSNPSVDNEIFTETDIIITRSGVYTLRLITDGKNGASTGYKQRHGYLSMFRTA